MAQIDIIIPAYREPLPETRLPTAETIRSLQCQCGTHQPWECPKGKHHFYCPPNQRSSIIHWARNAMISNSLYGPRPEGMPRPDYLFFLDDDMIGSSKMLGRLLSHNKDIVGGICTARTDPPKPTIRMWNAETGNYQQPLEWDWTSEKLMEVAGNGAAYLLVKRKVLESVADAWQDCKFEKERDWFHGSQGSTDTFWNKRAAERKQYWAEAHSKGEWEKMTAWWFDFTKTDDQPPAKAHGEVGEDLSFCTKVRSLGFRIFADPQVQPLHLGLYGYSLQDWIGFYEGQKQPAMAEVA